MEFKQEIEQNNEMLNSAFIDQKDLDITQRINQYDIENCYLDASDSEADFSLDRSIIRCAPSFPNSILSFNYSPPAYLTKNTSPIQLKNDYEQLDQEFTLPDSCLLFTTSDNLESEMDQLTIVSEISVDESQEEFCSEMISKNVDYSVKEKSTILSQNETGKISCKNVYTYLMKPIANKIAKKFNRKSLKNFHLFKSDKQQEQIKQELPKQEIPVKIYQTHQSNAVKFETPKRKIVSNRPTQLLNINYSNSPINYMDNNFVKCGEFVTYFV